MILAKEKKQEIIMYYLYKKNFPDMDYEELVRKRYDYVQKINGRKKIRQ